MWNLGAVKCLFICFLFPNVPYRIKLQDRASVVLVLPSLLRVCTAINAEIKDCRNVTVSRWLEMDVSLWVQKLQRDTC